MKTINIINVFVLFILFSCNNKESSVHTWKERINHFFSNERQIDNIEYFKDYRVVTPVRGAILDINNIVLVNNKQVFDIYIDFSVLKNHEKIKLLMDSLSHALSLYFNDSSVAYYRNMLYEGYNQQLKYHCIKRNIDSIQLDAIKTFPIFKDGQYKGGGIIEKNVLRKRNYGIYASRTLGYIKDTAFTNGDFNNPATGTGICGIEAARDSLLKGHKGLQVYQLQKNNCNYTMEEIEHPDNKKVIHGSNIITSLDIKMQKMVHNKLLNKLKKTHATWGTVVVMDVKTGDIKAIANLGKTHSGEYEEWYNYAIAQNIEPGSTFMPFSVMALLEHAYCKPNDQVPIKKDYSIAGLKNEDEYYNTDQLTVTEVIAKSSNVGMAYLIDKNYKNQAQKLISFYENIGVGKPTNINIPGEGVPVLYKPGNDQWCSTSLARISLGYQLKMTSLQLLTLYNAIANDGKMVMPKLVNGIQRNGKIERTPVKILNQQICGKQTLAAIKDMLVSSVKNGTGKKIYSDQYQIAGKNGMVEVNKYSCITYRPVFAGYFPADKPVYSCIVVINNPNIDYYGYDVAAPLFRDIADKIIMRGN